MKNKKRLLKLLLPAILVSLLFSGCGRSSALPQEDVLARMKAEMSARYGDDIAVSGLRNRNQSGSGPFSAKHGYEADGTDSAGRTFTVTYDADTGKVLDDYGKYAHRDEILALYREIAAEYLFLTEKHLTVYYPASDAGWTEDSSLEDYLDYSGAQLWAAVSMDEAEPDSSDALAVYFAKLQEKHLNATVTIYRGTKSVVFKWAAGEAVPDAAEIYNRLFK